MVTSEIEKGFQEIWKLFKETDRKFKETDSKFRETDKEIERTSKSVYALTGKWSKFVEGLIAPAVGAVGGVVIEECSDKYAYKKGLFVIAEKGDCVEIMNDVKFKPNVW